MKSVFLALLGISIFTSSAFAGGGGGLHFDHKIKEVKKAQCMSGASRLTFTDITYEDPEVGLFVSTNLDIETPGAPVKNYFVWARSVLTSLPRAVVLKLEKKGFVERNFQNDEAYFDIDINFLTGEGTLSASRYTGKMEAPYMTLSLQGCVRAK